MNDAPRILFAISDTGAGHRAGATAIDAALEQLVGGSVERRMMVDILAMSGTPFIRDAPDLYDHLSTRWLPVYDFLYRATDGRRRIELVLDIIYLQAHRNVLHTLRETQPNIVVSTHPLSTRLIAQARRSYRGAFHFMSVVTDLVSLHAAHADQGVDLCVAPTDEAYERLRNAGMPASKLLRTGFPVHPKFTACAATRQEARATLGIAQEPFTVLVTSGGVGSGNVHTTVLDLARAYPDLQLLVVTGKNEALRKSLQAQRLGPRMHIYGFVSNMEVLMAASDLVVTKAGPGTLMEALVMRRPVIVTQAVGMQEQGNIDFVLNHELGLFCPTPERMVPAVAELMHPATYAATIERLQSAVVRDGAMQIARVVQERLQHSPPVLRPRWLPAVGRFRQTGRLTLRPDVSQMRRRLRTSALRLRLSPRTRLSRWRR